jgi:hypothetical protein
VLKGIQQGMRLPAKAMLPSFAALRDYGNTSACGACAAALTADLHQLASLPARSQS